MNFRLQLILSWLIVIVREVNLQTNHTEMSDSLQDKQVPNLLFFQSENL